MWEMNYRKNGIPGNEVPEKERECLWRGLWL